MNQSQPILYLQQSCDQAVPYLIERMRQSGFQVMRTFDLQDTRAGETGCTCSHHGTETCDCQMVVLLVYGSDNQPASLFAHGHRGQTWISLAAFPGAENSQLEAQIRDLLTPVEGHWPVDDFLTESNTLEEY